MTDTMDAAPRAFAVAWPISLQCQDREGREHDLEVVFEYHPQDPFAVALRFGPEDHGIRWLLARDLLVRGITDPVGEGDVRIWPTTDRFGHSVVAMELRSPDGRLVAQASTREVYRFVTRTLVSVPAGTESGRLDVDLLVAQLLAASDSQ